MQPLPAWPTLPPKTVPCVPPLQESIWAFLCEAQMVGPEAARQQFLQVRRPLGLGMGPGMAWAVRVCIATARAPQISFHPSIRIEQ